MTRRLPLLECLGLAAVLLVGGWLRFAHLTTNPPGVFRDEAEKGLNAWALARTGQAFEPAPGLDGRPLVVWRRWPLFVDVYGVKTSAIYQYALAPLCRGDAPPSPGRLRAPAAAAGLLAILALYFIARALLGAPVALGAAMWLAISPWHTAFTRWALQGAFIPLFLTLGMGSLALGLRRKGAWLLPAGAAFGLAFYTYSGAQPFVAAFGLAVVAMCGKALLARERRVWAIGALALFFLFAGPAILLTLSPGGATRLERISAFGEGRGLAGGLGAVALNYARHYSPAFLLLRGDAHPRHGVPGFGELHLLEFLFAALGAWRLWRDRVPERGLWLAWLALFPVGAALTAPQENPHALRSLVLLPLPQLLAGRGMAWCMDWMKDRAAERGGLQPESAVRRRDWRALAAWTLVAAGIAASAGAFAWAQLVRYPAWSAPAWEAGFGEALREARHRADDPGNVYVTGSQALAPYLILYHDGVAPETLAAEGWGALRAHVLPPAPNFDLGAQWDAIPPGGALLALAQDRVDAAPAAIIVPDVKPASGAPEFPTYAVYVKSPGAGP